MSESVKYVKYIIGKTYTFEAAHKLPGYNGACKNMHGHSYKAEIQIKARKGQEGLNDQAMLMDFHVLDDIVQSTIEELDHSYLNKILKDPTAEMIASYLALAVDDKLSNTTRTVAKVKLYETEKCYVEVYLDA